MNGLDSEGFIHDVEGEHLSHGQMWRIILLLGVQTGLACSTAAMVFIGASLHIWGALLLRQTLAEEGVEIIQACTPSIQLLIKVTKVIRVVVQSQLLKPAYSPACK